MQNLLSLLKKNPITPFTEKERQEKGGHGFNHNGLEYIHHSPLPHAQTAYQRLSRTQIAWILGIVGVFTVFFAINWHVALVTLVSTITLLYFADLLFNLFIVTRSFTKPTQLTITDDQIKNRKNWPTYTVLCPLYKEWQVVPQFVDAMKKLDYPKDKLQIMLLLEEDDVESIHNVKKMNLPLNFDVVVVPHSKPKTKPKACNYGLTFATGEYTVIYDAEDVPDPLQLKKAVIGFENGGKKLKCIQAKLNFYNPYQNLLSRFFTAEYSLWFELVLTGLQSINAPIPLGGTSNHFRTADLDKLGKWDSFNVTEDCDLGIRLAKQGYQTAIIDSITLEEANSEPKNWFNQRTRWIKGYIQTYFLHMRNIEDFPKTYKEPHLITFQLVVGGKVVSMLINPFMWMITIVYFAFRSQYGDFIDSLFLAPIFYMGTLSLFLGNFLYLYFYMVGCAKNGHYSLVKYALFVPFYWLAMSMAAWVSLYQFIVAPHYWSKTKHGLHLATKTKNKAVKKETNTLSRPAFANA